MAESNLTSVVIVNYNCGRWLAECVRRVLASSIPVEVIVSDNGSSDESLEGLEEELGHRKGAVRVLRNGANLGFAKANNLAIRATSAPYVLVLNPDCLVEPDTLERVRNAMEGAPDAAIAGCLIRNTDGTLQEGSVRSLPSPWRSMVRVLRLDAIFPSSRLFQQVNVRQEDLPGGTTEVEGVSGAFMYVRRAAIEKVGTLDEGYFLHCEDLDWFTRFRAAGWKILFLPQVEVHHVKGACSGSRPVFVLLHKHKGMVRYYRKFLSRSYPLPLLWLVVGAVWARFALLAVPAALRGLRP